MFYRPFFARRAFLSKNFALSIKSLGTAVLYNKRVCPTKNEPQQGFSYLERERGGGAAGEQVNSQAYLRFS
jgi:hypothetical protein